MSALIYAVRWSGIQREYTNRRNAIAHARAIAHDGWPVSVYDMRTNAVVLKLDGQ